jgi:iron complex outermembrane receptor protein
MGQDDLQQEAVRGLSVGAGVYFQSQKEGDTSNSFELPGYGRIDALVKYRLPIAKAKTTLQFNVENLLDHRYYASTVGWSNAFVNLGQPRTFLGSVKVEFYQPHKSGCMLRNPTLNPPNVFSLNAVSCNSP